MGARTEKMPNRCSGPVGRDHECHDPRAVQLNFVALKILNDDGAKYLAIEGKRGRRFFQ
jgi:hypothetical protein